MYVKIRKKTLILFGILAALTVAGLCAGVLTLDCLREKERTRAQAEEAAGWRRSVSELSQSLSELETDLQKGLFSSGDYQTVSWAARVFAAAGAARTALESLPVYALHLEGTETFLNQVGEFTLEMARKRLRGETMTEEETNSLTTLAARSRELADEILSLSEQVADENPGYGELQELLRPSEEGEEATVFEGLENIFSEDTPLIYDGDHSAWHENRTSAWLESQDEITGEQAKALAAKLFGTSVDQIAVKDPVDTPFPYYECSYGENVAAVTVQGGKIYGFLRDKKETEAFLSLEAALYHGQSRLAELGYAGMEPILWEREENTVTAVYVLKQDGVLVFSDRITVSIAMDQGDLISMNAREFLLAHNPDRMADISVSQTEASSLLRQDLTVEDSRLVALPCGDGKEKLCWQITVRDETDTTALVYVNAVTKVEEDILLLVEGDGFRRMV